MKAERCVIDTNLLVSATLIESSRLFFGLKSFFLSEGNLIFTDNTFDELRNTLRREKFNKYTPLRKREQSLIDYNNQSIFVYPKRFFDICRDPTDNKFLDAAVAGKADCLITGDKDLLVLVDIEGIPIIKMADFLDRTGLDLLYWFEEYWHDIQHWKILIFFGY